MIKTYCDICGKEFVEKDKPNYSIRAYLSPDVMISDMCPSCNLRLIELIEQLRLIKESEVDDLPF
jgi:hypothetical protein